MAIEGGGGAAEKVAPLVKFPVVMRAIFPGIFAALCLYPFTDWGKACPRDSALRPLPRPTQPDVSRSGGKGALEGNLGVSRVSDNPTEEFTTLSATSRP
jgi:hypothetical protein